MSKIWVPGAKGLLGKALTREISAKGWNARATSHKEVDISKIEEVKSFLKNEQIDAIFNCAAYTNVDKAEEEAAAAYETNAIAPRILANVARQKNIPFVHFSTDYVFDGRGSIPYQESDPTSPINTYGATKLAGEIGILHEDPSACIIRTSLLFGEGETHFVARILKKLSTEEKIEVVADQVQTPTAAIDLAKGSLLLLQMNGSGIFHFTNSETVNRYLFAEKIFQEAKELKYPIQTTQILPILSTEYKSVAMRPKYSVLNTGKYATFTGNIPQNWFEALHTFLITHRQNV